MRVRACMLRALVMKHKNDPGKKDLRPQMLYQLVKKYPDSINKLAKTANKQPASRRKAHENAARVRNEL